ncbi:MAG: glycosyltransferase family 4 protein [Halobacteriota archaeon]
MRVAFVMMEPPHLRDTPAIGRVHRLARELADRDHEVVVLCSKWWDGIHRSFEQDGIEYRAVTSEPAVRTFATKLPFAIRKVRPDVLHVINTPPAPVRAANATSKLLRVPVVVDWWSDVDGDRVTSYRTVARGADRIVVPSRMVETMVREHGATPDSIHVIPEGVDMDRIRATPATTGVDMVYSRRLDEHANVETFLLALAELRDRDWNAVVIGDGPARPDVERTASDLRIDDRVQFVGELPIEDRISMLKGAHVFAQTAEFEPFAAELLLGLACGCVGLVEYQVGSSAHELVEGKSKLEGTRGRLVTSPQELAAEVVSTRDLDRLQIDEAYDSYSYDVVVDRYLSVYRDAVSTSGLF